MVSYKLVKNGQDSLKFIDRILKYVHRGFTLIVPHSFHEKYIQKTMILYNQNQTEIENRYNDNDKYESFQLNNDSMNVRNKFVDLCKKLELS